MLLIQADGASKGNPGPASYGAVLLTSSGDLVREVNGRLGVATNNQAEYHAVLAGLEAASKYFESHGGSRRLHIQMDSKLVIEQLSGRWKIKNSDLQQLAIRAQQLLRTFEVTLEWIPRELNSLADELANRALTPNGVVAEGVGDFIEQIEVEVEVQPKSIRAPRQHKEPVVVWAIRHGHTAMTESGLISGGDADPGLSEFGLLEADRIAGEMFRLAELFELPLPTRLLHSPQRRAVQTANAMLKHIPMTRDERGELREIGFGEWEGISMTNLEAPVQELIAQWRGSVEFRPPGGESVADLDQRVSGVLHEALASTEPLAIVAHMMPMRAIYRLATKAPMQAHWNLNFLPASISVYRFFGLDFAEVFAVNSTTHLERLSK